VTGFVVLAPCTDAADRHRFEQVAAAFARRDRSTEATRHERGASLSCFRPPSVAALGPVPWRDERLSVVAHGRLDRRDVLRRELARAGTTGQADSDIELIAAAYRAWGVEAPLHLHGDFSFVVWDGRSGELFAARDRVGAKALFLGQRSGSLALATEPNPIVELPGFGRAVNEGFCAEYLADAMTSTTETVFADVQRLPRGHALHRRADGSLRTWRYWDFDLHAPAPAGSPEDLAEELAGRTEQAVARCLRGARTAPPVSGGAAAPELTSCCGWGCSYPSR